VTSKWITISDNGRGMSREELNNFFQMHGENIQRKRGKRVRGRFGTGKCAAFGLANHLRIDTSQGGICNVVELRRQDIEQAQSGEAFPVRDIRVNETTDKDDGTIVEITSFNTRKRPNVDKVMKYVQRQLSRYHQRTRVIINGHECQFGEIPFAERFERHPPPNVAKRIRDVSLIIKVSPKPLDDDTNGVDIFSHGIWHETTLANIEKKERANYIFGEIDVPILEDREWPIPAFDNTRNNTLNRQNPVVAVLLGWLSDELEQVRLELVKKESERRKSQEAKKLAREAKKIADVLNQDFVEQAEMELELARRVARRSGSKLTDETSDAQGDLWPGDGNEPTPWEQTGAPHGAGKRGETAGPGDTARPGPTVRPGDEPGSRKSATPGSRKRRRGIFSIEFVNETTKETRSRYDGKTKTIYVNLDHPQIAKAFAAGGQRTENQHFRQVCYEVAAVEYAIAIPFEKTARDEMYDAPEALFDVRETINRVTRRLVNVLYN
jgi:hypothetical protein